MKWLKKNEKDFKNMEKIRTCGKLKAVLLSPIIANESRIWLTWWCNFFCVNIQFQMSNILLIIGNLSPDEKIPYQYFCPLQFNNKQITYHQKILYKTIWKIIHWIKLILVIGARNGTYHRYWGLVEELHSPFVALIFLLHTSKENISI